MSTLSIYNYFELTTDEGDTFEGGSRTTPKTITLTDGIIFEKRTTVDDATAAGDVVTLWTSSESGFTSFEFLYFEADEDCLLELNNGTEIAVFQINANVPLMLGHDDMDAAALDGGGLETALITNIEVEGLTDDTRVRLVLMK